jgi:hypothetical protein
VIRFGKRTEERPVPVRLSTQLTAVGTLEIWAESRISDHRWRLQFELRKAAQAEQPSRPAAVIGEEGLQRAEELIRATFGTNPTIDPPQLPGQLEQALALGRNSWPLATIRRFGDLMLELAEGRGRSPAHEERWLNLAGFFLRPGFGYPGDDYRIEQARRVYAQGLRFPNQVQCEIQWWIFWGRVAGGLNRNQQTDMYQRLSPYLLPKQNRKVRVNSSLLREMWRTAASLELLPLQTKSDLGDATIRRLKGNEGGPSDLWCIARIGARRLFYGPNNLVVPPAAASRWVDALLKVKGAEEALVGIAQVTGDVGRDLPPAVVSLVRARLQDAPELLATLEGERAHDLAAMGRVFGEELPSGLVFADERTAAG